MYHACAVSHCYIDLSLHAIRTRAKNRSTLHESRNDINSSRIYSSLCWHRPNEGIADASFHSFVIVTKSRFSIKRTNAHSKVRLNIREPLLPMFGRLLVGKIVFRNGSPNQSSDTVARGCIVRGCEFWMPWNNKKSFLKIKTNGNNEYVLPIDLQPSEYDRTGT